MKSIYNVVFVYFWLIYYVLWCKFVNLFIFCCVRNEYDDFEIDI